MNYIKGEKHRVLIWKAVDTLERGSVALRVKSGRGLAESPRLSLSPLDKMEKTWFLAHLLSKEVRLCSNTEQVLSKHLLVYQGMLELNFPFDPQHLWTSWAQCSQFFVSLFKGKTSSAQLNTGWHERPVLGD